jgi:[ribosomal protein S5]-alanine N-acetyltransferase
MNLITPRLHLRPIVPEDLPVLVALWTDPDVTRFLGGPREPFALRAGLAEDLLPDAPAFNLWPVLERSSGQVVGHCGILDKMVDGRTEFELVYVFAHAAWGKGYATEIGLALRHHAFRALGLSRLISLIEPENAASRRVAEKVGMHHQGDTVRPGGRTMCVYACASMPWRAIRGECRSQTGGP